MGASWSTMRANIIAIAVMAMLLSCTAEFEAPERNKISQSVEKINSAVPHAQAVTTPKNGEIKLEGGAELSQEGWGHSRRLLGSARRRRRRRRRRWWGSWTE